MELGGTFEITYDDRDFTDLFVSLWTEFAVNLEAQVRAAEGREFPEEDRLALEQELTTLVSGVLEHRNTRDDQRNERIRRPPPTTFSGWRRGP